MQEYSRDGISFKFPTNWRAEAEDTEDGGWAVTVSSPDTAFALVSLRPDAGPPADLADQILDALRADYPELDAENRVETVGGVMAVGHDIDFLTLDAAVACRTRALDTLAGALVVMTQVSGYDRAENEPVLRAVVASVTIED
ncbi:hypothetical protein [Gemmata sp.]|uniref:hypothetical protein n=1 Tax=Gemmata sp. TaxID=1914242 RepID=UPI003F7135DD